MSNLNNPYAGRWRWWYSGIADWMISHPDGKLSDCAAALGKSTSTISMIVNTDLFRDHLAQRKRDWQERHDIAIISRVQKVAEASLDILLKQLEAKKDAVPIQTVKDLAMGTLDRLGYSPSRSAAPGVVINNNVVGAASVRPSVSIVALEEAREAYRLVQEKNRRVEIAAPSSAAPPYLNGNGASPRSELAEQLEEADSGPLTLSTD